MTLHPRFDSLRQRLLEAAGAPGTGGGLCRGTWGTVDTEVGPLSAAIGSWEGEDIPICFPCKVEGEAPKAKKPGCRDGGYVGAGGWEGAAFRQAVRTTSLRGGTHTEAYRLKWSQT